MPYSNFLITIAFSNSLTMEKEKRKRFHFFSTIKDRFIIDPFSYKGGDPAPPSDRATLLRLHPSHQPYLRHLPPYGWVSDFGQNQLPWCDGRCVQGPGTYSRRCADTPLLAIPTSWSRVADSNLNLDRFFGIGATLRLSSPLYRPL